VRRKSRPKGNHHAHEGHDHAQYQFQAHLSHEGDNGWPPSARTRRGQGVLLLDLNGGGARYGKPARLRLGEGIEQRSIRPKPPQCCEWRQ